MVGPVSAPAVALQRAVAPARVAALLLRAGFFVVFAGFIVGPLLVLALWSVAQQWFWPSLLPFRPSPPCWFAWALTVPDIFRSLQNSLLVAVLVTVCTTVVAVTAAFAIGRY